MENNAKAIQQQLLLIERITARLTKAQLKLHLMAERMLQQHGPVVGLSSDVVAPKEPPE